MVADLTVTVLIRIVLASFLGALIGLEREIHGRPAGFRTHLLVSLGSCLFVLTSIHFYQTYGNLSGTGPVGTDPARVAAQVVTGIGFLGAGAIIREKAAIRGLTTAACLWIAAAVGMACGAGMHATATVVTILGLLSLLLLKKIEERLDRDTYFSVMVWSGDVAGQMARIEELLTGARIAIVNINIEKNSVNNQVYYEYEVRGRSKVSSRMLIESIAALDGVTKVRVE